MRFEYRDDTSVLPRFREVMDEENRVENQDQEVYSRCGSCFKALFGIPFEPGALLTMRPRWLPEPPQGWLNCVRWQGL